MTNTDTADIPLPSSRLRRWPGPDLNWSGSRSTTKRPPQPSRRLSSNSRQQGVQRAHHRRLPLQRTPSAQEVSRVRAGAGQVPHQSRQCRHRTQGRQQFPHHDRGCGREPEAGAHRRELGIARPGAAHPHDGRELASGRTERRARSDHGSDGGERAELGQHWPKNTDCGPTRLFSARKSAACRT